MIGIIMRMAQRTKRHELIRSVLASVPVQSQEELAQHLARSGVTVTQATLSRDLRDLGVAKGPLGYVLLDGVDQAEAQADPSARMLEVIETYVRSVEPAAGLVVVKTGPGQAQVVAVELDRKPMPEIAGTIAGDDTIFLAVKEEHQTHELVASLRALAGLSAATLAEAGEVTA